MYFNNFTESGNMEYESSVALEIWNSFTAFYAWHTKDTFLDPRFEYFDYFNLLSQYPSFGHLSIC